MIHCKLDNRDFIDVWKDDENLCIEIRTIDPRETLVVLTRSDVNELIKRLAQLLEE